MAHQISVTVTMLDFDNARLDEVEGRLQTQYAGDSKIERVWSSGEVTLTFESEMRGDETADGLASKIEAAVRTAHGGDRVSVTADIS